MNIKQRTLLSIGAPLAALAAGISILFNIQLLGEFKNLERTRLETNVYRVLFTIDGMREELLLKAIDWGQWDASYNFISDRNEEFVRGTLPYDSLAAIKLRHALYFSNDRELVVGQQLDYDKQEIRPIEPDELNAIMARSEFFAHKSHDDVHSAIMLIGNHYYFVAASPIVPSKRDAAPRGTLIFTQPINDEVVKRVGLQTQVNVDFQDVRRSTAWSPADKEALAEMQKTEKPTVAVASAEEVYGYGLVSEASGKPALLIKLRQERDIYQQGIAVRNYLVVALICSLALALITCLALFHSAILKRLHLISARLGEITKTQNIAQRVPVTGNDEISELANDLNSMLRALEEANKARSTFVAKVSHELRTPLGSVIGMLRILLKQEESEAKRAYISMASNSAYGLLDTINEILDFSKVEAGKLAIENVAFKLRDMLHEALYAVAPRIEEKGTLELLYDIAPDVPDEYVGDPLRLKQCIVNLLGNAAKFTPQGCITVLVTALEQSADRVTVCIEVTDTGVGIPEDRISKIFDPFTQADDSITRVYTGTGLGLTLVKQTAEAMGGKVRVASTVGVGSTFTLTLPLKRSSSVVEEKRHSLPAGATVVIIDGESSVARFMAEKMPRYGVRCEVVSYEDVTRLSSLSTAADKPRLLVVTSVAVKESAVFDLVATSATEKRIPIVVILSPFEIAARERLVALGVPYIVTRPVSVEDILLTVSGVPTQPSRRWKEDHEAALSHARPLKVLVVDDVRTNQIILREMLENAGHAVTCLENGIELFDVIERSLREQTSGERFDVVLTDIEMPHMDGITATKKIRQLEQELKTTAPLPIFAVTAHALTAEAHEMKMAGFNGVITKPIEPRHVAQALEEVPLRGDSEALASTPSAKQTSSKGRPNWESIEELSDLVRRLWKKLEIDEERLRPEENSNAEWSVEQMLDVHDIYTRTGKSLQSVEMILRVFSESFKDQLMPLVAARNSSDKNELFKAAHSMKGLLLAIGAKQPAALAARIDSMCKKGEAEESKRFITPLSEQVLLIARLVERILETLESNTKEGKKLPPVD